MRLPKALVAVGACCAGALVLPHPALADTAPICADRPSKATGVCTVPTGVLQIESGLVDWAHDASDGEHTDFTMFGSSLIKFGVSDRVDLELGITPLEVLSTRSNRSHERASGFGDVVLRSKLRLTRDNAPVEVALDPFVKLPTAGHELGNGKVEGGVVAPLSADLGSAGVSLSLGPELDLLADADERGHHPAMIQVVNLGAQINSSFSVSAELWGQWDYDPAGTVRQASADASVAFLPSKDVQLDAGANVGLNRQTPDLELYAGVSKRF